MAKAIGWNEKSFKDERELKTAKGWIPDNEFPLNAKRNGVSERSGEDLVLIKGQSCYAKRFKYDFDE